MAERWRYDKFLQCDLVLSRFDSLLGQTLCPTDLNILCAQSPAGLDHLHHVDELLDGHDGEADGGQNPWNRRVHLVCTCHLKGCSAEGVREYLTKNRCVELRVGNDGIASGILYGLDQVRREEGRGEGQQVECDEEELIEEACDEQDSLKMVSHL